jgi:hypothetical protein
LKLGAYPGLSLKQARDLAERELGRMAAGEDPQAEREEVRARDGWKLENRGSLGEPASEPGRRDLRVLTLYMRQG